MMTNQNPAQGYEIGIFNQLVKNSEAIALTQFKVEELGKKVTKIEEQVNKIPELESRLVQIENRLDNVETKITNIDNRLTNIEQIGEKILGSVKYVIGAIALGILINVLSLPALNLFK